MVKIGLVSIDVSHPKTFATYFESNCMDMKFQYLVKESFRDDTEADWFVNRYKLEGVMENIPDMVDKVDIGFIQSCNWDKHLDQAMPFIEKGKPVFIDKPVVGSVKDIERFRELIKNGARIYGGSSLRYCNEITDFLKKDVAERGEVMALYCTCGVDEFSYAIHVIEGFSALAQSKAKSGRYLGDSVAIGGKKVETYGVDFENGVRGVYHLVCGSWYPFCMTIVTTKRAYNFKVDGSTLYGPLLKEIYREVTFGTSNLTDSETLINCTQAMLCGKKSKEVYNGGEVTVDMLEETDGFDGYQYEAEYGAKAAVLYKG